MQDSLTLPKSIRSSCIKLASKKADFRLILNIRYKTSSKREVPTNVYLVVGGNVDTYALGRDP